MSMHSILVVDDEPNYLVVLSELLRDEGFEVFTAHLGKMGSSFQGSRSGSDHYRYADAGDRRPPIYTEIKKKEANYPLS